MPKYFDRIEVTSLIERLDAENRRLAKKLDELKYIVALYGLLDGLSTAYSTLVYFFNVADTATSSAEAMHDWMGTSSGIAVAATETITLVAFSFLANIFDDKDEKAFKRYIAIAWPYCRDSIKGLKNAYKGVRSGLQTVGMLSGHDLQNMIIPLGLGLGAISILNRVCMRMFVKDVRVSKMKANTLLLSEIQGTALHFMDLPSAEEMLTYKNSYIVSADYQLYYITNDGSVEEVPIANRSLFEENIKKINPKREISKLYLSYKDTQTLVTDNGGYVPPISGFDRQECEQLRAKIGEQSLTLNRWALLGAGYGGVVDGLYLYMGALGLTALSPPVFIAMAVCSTIFSSMCVATRVYEEYDFQRKLKATQAKVELALYCKQLETLLGAVKRLRKALPSPSERELELLLIELRETKNPDLLSPQSNSATADFSIAELDRLWEAYKNADSTVNENAKESDKDAKKRDFIKQLKKACDSELGFTRSELGQKRKDVEDFTKLSGDLAIFTGLRSGLAVYGAITSIIFAVATVNAIFLAPFPPTFLIAGVIVGMVCLIASLIHTLINMQQVPSQATIDPACEALFRLMSDLKFTGPTPTETEPQDVREAILKSMNVAPSPQSDVQKWAEVFRSLGSGFSKGPRLLNFLSTMWPAADAQVSDNDSSIWLQVSMACAVVQGVVFALMAWTKTNRDTPDTIKQPAWVTSGSPLVTNSIFQGLRTDRAPPIIPESSTMGLQ